MVLQQVCQTSIAKCLCYWGSNCIHWTSPMGPQHTPYSFYQTGLVTSFPFQKATWQFYFYFHFIYTYMIFYGYVKCRIHKWEKIWYLSMTSLILVLSLYLFAHFSCKPNNFSTTLMSVSSVSALVLHHFITYTIICTEDLLCYFCYHSRFSHSIFWGGIF